MEKSGEDEIVKMQRSKDRWLKCLEGQKITPGKTDWGEELEVLYTPLDVTNRSYLEHIGFPGEYPFVRGIHPSMYLGRPWTIRQYSGFGTAEETNARYRYLLDQGQTGLSVAFDLPTQLGYDSDDPLSEGEVGKVGVAVDSLRDMEILFEGLPLDKLSTSMTINAPAAILLAMYIAVADKKGIPSKKLRGTIQNDILKEYTARGTYIFPPKPSIRLITDTFSYCSKHVPLWNTINVGGYHLREAGCSAVQEIAFAFSNAIEYIRAAINAGLDIDSFAPRISWIFNTSNKIFEEVAKYRAARRIWADIVRFRFKAKNPRSWILRFHTQTSGASLTAQQPQNNIIRVAYQALAAVLGGAQSIAACSYDEALSIPTEESVMLSLRTQQILLHEAGVTDTVDPLGGSYYVEALTEKMENEIADLIGKIDEMGGAIKAIEMGFVQREIERRAYQIQKEIEEGKRIVVGMNKYEIEEELKIPIFKADPKVTDKQVSSLRDLKKNRNSTKVRSTLDRIRKAAESGENLMPVFIEAVKAYATLGEICGVLRSVFGEYSQPSTLN